MDRSAQKKPVQAYLSSRSVACSTPKFPPKPSSNFTKPTILITKLHIFIQSFNLSQQFKQIQSRIVKTRLKMAYYGGTLKSNSMNGVKVYSITGQQRSLASWLNPKKQRALRKDQEYQQRVELIQDLRFETATTKIKATPDGEFVIASGIYPPQIKVYELRELSLKFERHLVSEIVDFEVLSDDYSKLAFLCADRSIRLHAKYGSHHHLRIPRMGRDMAYDSWSCDLLCAASSPDLYRINLSQGRFLSPLPTQLPALNVVSRSKLHGLVACGGEDGAIECFDMRIRSSVGRINAVSAAGENDQEVTAISFNEDGGFQMAVGSSEGNVLIYDLRSSQPLRVKDHMYGSPILDIKWHRTLNSQRPKLITTDNHIVRIWDPETMEGFTSIEPTGGAINDICVFNESGLMLLALDSSHIPSFFIPSLGPAPKWCSYLENLTEEQEETNEIPLYENYKFLTMEELERLNLTNLIGTDLVRAVMHGFVINYKLYRKVKDLVDPVDRKSYMEQRIKEKIAQEARITIRKRLPKVNKEIAREILEKEEADKLEETDTNKKSKSKKKGLTSDILKDDRFGSFFENPDFQIDENSEEFKTLHPITSTSKKLVEEHFDPILEEDSMSVDSDASASSDDEGGAKKKARVPMLHEAKDERHAQAYLESISLANEDALTIEQRVASLGDHKKASDSSVKVGPGGSREISFVAKSKGKYKENEGDEDPRRNKRGVNSLRLKPTNYEKKSSGGRGGGRGGGGGRGRGRGRGGRGRGRF